MKNKLFTLAAALALAAVIGGIYAAPALAVVIKAALVKNIDEPGRNPVQQTITSSSGSIACPVVQPGQRMVLEHLNVVLQGSGSLDVPSTDLKIGTTTFRLLFSDHGGDPGGNETYTIDQRVLAFVNSADTCSIGLYIYGGTLGTARATYTGYTVDLNN